MPSTSADAQYEVSLAAFEGGGSSTVSVGGQLFEWREGAGDGDTAASRDSTTCKSVTVRAGIDDAELGYTDSGSVQVQTDGTVSETMHVVAKHIAERTFSLGPQGAYALVVNLNPPSGTFARIDGDESDGALYLDATFTCSTPNGR